MEQNLMRQERSNLDEQAAIKVVDLTPMVAQPLTCWVEWVG